MDHKLDQTMGDLKYLHLGFTFIRPSYWVALHRFLTFALF